MLHYEQVPISKWIMSTDPLLTFSLSEMDAYVAFQVDTHYIHRQIVPNQTLGVRAQLFVIVFAKVL